jgi:hypothetical protein
MAVKNGKGDKPRNCYSKDFKSNYDEIQWSSKNAYEKKKKKEKHEN